MNGGRALILADIEGISGVDDWRDIIAGTSGYPAACRHYALDVQAAVRGLRAGGAADVLVVDTHAAGTNIGPDDVPDAEVIIDPSIMARIDQAIERGVDALALVGFHAAAGTADSFVPHSFNPQTRSWLNGIVAGEPAFYALLLGARGVPTVFISGDARTIEQTRLFAAEAKAVETKQALSPFAARTSDAEVARAAIEATTADAYRNRRTIPPSVLPAPIELTVEARHEVGARLIAHIPGMSERDGNRCSFVGDWLDIWRSLITANSLAALSAVAGGSWYFGPIAGSLVERLRLAAGADAAAAQGAFAADQFSPPWGPPCPPEAIPS